MILQEAVLLHATEDGLRTVIEQRTWDKSGAGPALRPVGLPEDVWLDALALHREREPVLLLEPEGIFVLRDAAVHGLLTADLRLDYHCNGVICVSGATDLIEGPDSSFYVSTTLLSVIRFRRGPSDHSVEQLLLPTLP